MTLEELHVKIVGNVRSFMGSMDDVEKRVSSTASKLKSFGSMASTYVTLPLLGIGAAAVKTASDVEEMNAKAETVFRNQIGMVREWAAETGDAVGRSENKLVGYAAALQDTFVPMGFARDRASELSTQMTQLAVDLASFNNTTDQQALNALQSALVGNHETMKQFGVVINQTALDQELLAMGIQGGIDAATEQQKVMARLNLIMKGTKDAQGDAARTSESFANQMKRLRGEFYDASAQLMKDLLPTLTDLVTAAGDAVQWFTDLPKPLQNTALAAAGVAAAIGPIASGIGSVLSILPALKTGMIAVFTAIKANLVATGIGALLVGLGTAAYFVYENWDWVKKQFKIIFGKIKIWALQLQEKLLGFADKIASKFSAIFPGIADGAKSMLKDTRESLRKAKQELQDAKDIKIGEESPPEVPTQADPESNEQTGEDTRDNVQKAIGEIPVPVVVPENPIVEGDKVELDDSIVGSLNAEGILGMDAGSFQSINEVNEALRILRERYNETTDPKIRNRIAQQTQALQEQKSKLDVLNQSQKRSNQTLIQQYQVLNNAISSFGDGVGEAFATAVMEGKNFAQQMAKILKSVMKQLVATLIRAFALAAILTALGQGPGFGASFTGFLKGGSIGDVMDMSATSSGAGVANSISRKGSTQKVAVELSSTKVADGVVFNANESGKTSRTRRVYG